MTKTARASGNILKKIKPLGDRVLVRPISKEETTESGIIIPDTAKEERPQEGEVLAVGPGKLNEKGERIVPEVKVGDRVMFKKYSPEELKIEGEEFLIVNESDILAVIG
ncbi:co-chaperone GroES [candidate division CPR3 bacterium 4484_211]|uniref:Co-chaperonin GroES n=1 Tax=candidate division CPR3 bacterium 4484_211 TaxID=1968527 RepID=A0A1W9NXY0_UNCC3|nr:MAG: co-chaperone GroES [candidate division CPR3 bacterium 4484_211]